MKIKTIVLILFVLVRLEIHGQTINTIDNVKLNIPGKLVMVYNQSSTKSYSCQTLKNKIAASYRITITDFSKKLQKFDDKGKKGFIETYLDKIKNNASTTSKNIKVRTFYNLMAIQYDDYANMGDMILQARTFVFMYKSKSISFNYVSSPSSFDSHFEMALKNLSLIDY
jgi:hypothetical protein